MIDPETLTVAGLLDAGRLGIADRWLDLAIAVRDIGELPFELVRRRVTDMLVVPERAIEEAIGLLIEGGKTVAEGAGAASVAALLTYPARFRGRRVGLAITGGNIDARILSNVLLRAEDGKLALSATDMDLEMVASVACQVARKAADRMVGLGELVKREIKTGGRGRPAFEYVLIMLDITPGVDDDEDDEDREDQPAALELLRGRRDLRRRTGGRALGRRGHGG